MEADKNPETVDGDQQIKKMEKPRGRGSQANPAPTLPLLPTAGGRARADAAERTSVPMETAEVGEGSQAQLMSLQGDSRAGDPGGLINARKPRSPPAPNSKPAWGGGRYQLGRGVRPAPGTVLKPGASLLC